MHQSVLQFCSVQFDACQYKVKTIVHDVRSAHGTSVSLITDTVGTF